MRFFMFVIALAGCTHHRHIAEAHGLGGEAVVVSGPQGKTPAVGVETPSGVEFHDARTGRVLTTAEIDTIEDQRRGRGALDGLAWGSAIGAGIGIVAGFADGDDVCSDGTDDCWLAFSATEKATMGGAVIGSLGALVGLLVGAAVGSTDIYEYPGASEAVVTPGGPPGSTAGVTVSF